MQMPQAPPPPPLHYPIDHQLPARFDGLRLDTDTPHFIPNPASHGPMLEGHHDVRPQEYTMGLSHNVNAKESASYEGYIFTKLRPELPGQTETWSRVKKTPMAMSQKTLYAEAKKQKNKGPSDKDMIGFKRRQIDHLIEQRTRTDEDVRFEYKLASLKLKQGINARGQRETTSMQVILKRQLRPGVAQAATMGFRAEGPGEIVDLTRPESDDRSSQDSYPISGNSFSGHQELPGMHGQQHFEPHMHGGQGVNVPMPPSPQMEFLPQHDQFIPPGHQQPGMHHQGPFMGQNGHPPGFPPEHPHVNHHPPHDNHLFPQDHHAQPKAAKKDKAGKKDSKDKKDKKGRKKAHKSHDKHYEGFSDGISDSSNDDSDASYRTPDTVISSNSSRDYFKEKKYHSGHKEKRRHVRDYERDHSPRRQVYREHRRKSPVRSPRAERPRYEYEDYDIIPSGHRDRPHPARRATDYMERRPALDHHRALSYDDDFHHDIRRSSPLGRRPTSIYTQGRLKAALPIDLYHGDRERDDFEREVRKEAAARELLRDRELKDRELRERELRDRELRERELRDRELRDRELRDREVENLRRRERARREDDLFSRDRMVRDPLDRPAFGDRLGRFPREPEYY